MFIIRKVALAPMKMWAPLMVLAVVLAGCLDGAGTQDDDYDDIFEDVEVDQDKGIIRGVVFDETISPVAGASVEVMDTETTATTGAEGAFLIEDLAPGNYFLRVSKGGFESVQTSTEVVAGLKSPPVLKVQLPRLPGSEPFVIPLSYDAFISCGFKTFNIVWNAFYCDPTGQLGMEENDDSVRAFDIGRTDQPAYYQSEIDWEAAQLLSTGLVTIQCMGDDAGCCSGVGSDRLCNVRGEAPLVCRIAADTPSEEVPGGGNNFTTIREGAGFDGRFAVGLFSNCAVCFPPETPVCVAPGGIAVVCPGMGFGLSIDQEVQMYVHVFYNFSPDEGWLFLMDGPPAMPA